MNYHSHVKDIRKLLLMPDKRPSANPNKPDQPQFYKGVYVISRDKDLDKNDKLQYKIGMAFGMGGLYKRLSSYTIAMPYSDEFFIHFMILTTIPEHAKKLETKILSQNNMKAVPNPRNENQNSEYRIVVKKETLHDSLLKALRDNSELWDYVIIFGNSGWKVLENTADDLVSSGKLSKPANDMEKMPLPYGEQPMLQSNQTEIIDVKRNQAVNINTIRKNDMIKDKWGLAKVQKVSKKHNFIDVISEKYPDGYILRF